MAAEPPPPGRASGTSSGNSRGGRGQGRGHQVGRGCGRSGRLGPPAGARRAREAGAGAGSGGARGKAAAPGLAQTLELPSPGTGGPPRPPRRRRRRSPKPCAWRREHIHRGVPAASGRRRLSAPGVPAPRRRLTRLPGALRPARAHRSPGRRAPRRLRLRLRLRQAPTPGPNCQARNGCSVRALPLATHTHFLLSLNWSTDPGGRRRRRQRRREEKEEGGGGRGRREREAVPPGPSWKALLGSQPPRAPPRAALASPALLPGWAGPSGSAGASCSRALCGARGRSGHGRPRRGWGRVPVVQPGPPPTCRCRPPGRGKAGIWRTLPAFQPTGPGTRPRPSGKPRASAPRAPARAAPAHTLPSAPSAAAALALPAPGLLRSPRGAALQPLLYSFAFLFLKRHLVRKYLSSPVVSVQ